MFGWLVWVLAWLAFAREDTTVAEGAGGDTTVTEGVGGDSKVAEGAGGEAPKKEKWKPKKLVPDKDGILHIRGVETYIKKRNVLAMFYEPGNSHTERLLPIWMDARHMVTAMRPEYKVSLIAVDRSLATHRTKIGFPAQFDHLDGKPLIVWYKTLHHAQDFTNWDGTNFTAGDVTSWVIKHSLPKADLVKLKDSDTWKSNEEFVVLGYVKPRTKNVAFMEDLCDHAEKAMAQSRLRGVCGKVMLKKGKERIIFRRNVIKAYEGEKELTFEGDQPWEAQDVIDWIFKDGIWGRFGLAGLRETHWNMIDGNGKSDMLYTAIYFPTEPNEVPGLIPLVDRLLEDGIRTINFKYQELEFWDLDEEELPIYLYVKKRSNHGTFTPRFKKDRYDQSSPGEYKKWLLRPSDNTPLEEFITRAQFEEWPQYFISETYLPDPDQQKSAFKKLSGRNFEKLVSDPSTDFVVYVRRPLSELAWDNSEREITEVVDEISKDPEFSRVRFGSIVQDLNDTPFGWVSGVAAKLYPAKEGLDLEDFMGTTAVPENCWTNLDKMKEFLRRKAVTVKKFNSDRQDTERAQKTDL